MDCIQNNSKTPVHVLVWGIGYDYTCIYNMLKYEELKNNIYISAMITTDTKPYQFIDGYPLITPDEIDCYKYDCIIVTTGEYYNEVKSKILSMNIKVPIIAGALFSKIPHFDFKDYWRLLCNIPSIIANRCHGGLLYHDFKLPFNSPFINSAITPKSFIDLLTNFDSFLESTLEITHNKTPTSFLEGKITTNTCDIPIIFPHDTKPTEVLEKWNRRFKRINSDNLIIILFMDCDDYNLALRFSQLPFKTKYCLCSYDYNLPYVYNIHYDETNWKNHMDFWTYFHHILPSKMNGGTPPINWLSLLTGQPFMRY